MKSYILSFQEMDKESLMTVGGKGLNLGELSKIDGVKVPEGFCVTTEAYRKAIENNQELEILIEKLTALKAEDRKIIAEISKEIRILIEKCRIPQNVENEIAKALAHYGENHAYAIRSSATAEDLPHASFAGQQDTYLNIKGKEEVLQSIIKCWASLFTERAVVYRIQNGFDHRKVLLSVVVQKMILSEVSGIMFTTDPMTSDRKTLSIDAGFGLGEALVSGLVNPDSYKVRGGIIVEKSIGTQRLAIQPRENGGTQKVKLQTGKQAIQALSEEQILELARIGKKIEAHFNTPQDIEWCFFNNKFYIVQSRTITTLFPIPESVQTKIPRVYMSIGHTQMMTDSIRPLGMSFFEFISTTKLDKAGGRVFADITHDLSSVVGRKRLVMASGKQDPLIQNAIQSLLEDKNFVKSLPKGERNVKGGIFTAASIIETIRVNRRNDPSVIESILAEFEQELKRLEEQLSQLEGEVALEFIRQDRNKLLEMAYDPRMLGAIMAAILANDSLNKNMEKWIGEKQVADALIKSLDHNVTTEMGLALCDLADVIRKYPEVLSYLAGEPTDESFYEAMIKLSGGKEVQEAFQKFLARYGMRCPGEIDLTKDRWEEKPTQLIPMILNNVRGLEQGEHKVRFQKGKEEVKKKEAEILRKLEQLSGGNKKVKKFKKYVNIIRNFIGCREYPKYYIVRRYQVYKKALIKEAHSLVKQGMIKNRGDIDYLYFEELLQAVKNNKLDYAVIEKRKTEYVRYEKLTPPRIITSDGYVPPTGNFGGNMPKDALGGIPVSAGVVEGRARVVLSVQDAKLEPGDILVTQFTDPSWTPLFVNIKGLVTEVGGFTTHGAVITREYGLPGVVGVENATKHIKDGQRIRVNGTEGFVEIL